MIITRLTLVLFAVFSAFTVTAQERGIPVYKDYLMDNYYLIHPSMAGTSAYNKARITARQQWFDVEDAPSLQTASVNARFGENVGLGAILYNDSNGRFSQQGGYLTFAYHLLFSRSTADINQLSFGMNVGISQEKLDETDINIIDNPDPIISGVEQTDNYFNMDFGLSYFYLNYFVHATVKNIIPQKRQIFTELFETDNQRQYLVSLGYTYEPELSNWVFEPSVMYQNKEATGESNLDVNAKAYYLTSFGNLWGGLSYRRSLDAAEFSSATGEIETAENLQNLSPFLGVNYGKFVFAYMYTYQTNSIVLSNSGFHQITLGYNFGENRRRYKCKCPAVNY
ncbi:type IX secretion system membrane protein, PorP/SprF family [Psychroflexus salarius]|jgi:type IX secretion system PorP/SprF family membrane protein|uniref:Type IX secretion system membrane protein, PorP/SprF family n=1 Tax=Psychroflexus salarius TaxID=1155689 RepID=A0A1M4Y3G1_9FLAO|nr:type IX secretion system membrane protein PorP/SprF [Psychroflexus salarius]SHF00354.1 type IX secretion system membrane protein, PorP/SprF family [Psychroflexus salarius]